MLVRKPWLDWSQEQTQEQSGWCCPQSISSASSGCRCCLEVQTVISGQGDSTRLKNVCIKDARVEIRQSLTCHICRTAHLLDFLLGEIIKYLSHLTEYWPDFLLILPSAKSNPNLASKSSLRKQRS